MTDTLLVLVANAAEGSISTFRLADGSLERLAVTDGLTGCSTFAVDPGRDLVYAAVKGEPAGIASLRLDRSTGRLSPHARVDLEGGGVNYLALTRGGDGLLAASYGGGYGISAPIVDGVVGAPVSRVAFANLHSVLPSADGRFAYFVSLGDDLVAQYALDDDLGLIPLDPPVVRAPEGSGPRHLVLNAAEDAVYVLTEFSGHVLHFARDTSAGTLELVGRTAVFDPTRGLAHSRFGADPRAEHLIWGADLHLDAQGQWLWASERTESTLSAAAVGTDGSVSAPTEFTVTEPQPRGFALSPDGAYLVAAGERSVDLALYAVDQDRLTLRDRVETGRGPNWVRFV